MQFTNEEMDIMKSNIEKISTHIPENLMGWVWDTYGKINKRDVGPRPCACPSSAKLWRNAIETIREYVNLNPQ